MARDDAVLKEYDRRPFWSYGGYFHAERFKTGNGEMATERSSRKKRKTSYIKSNLPLEASLVGTLL